MIETLNFSSEGIICKSAKDTSRTAVSWYKTLLFYCSTYYYNNRSIQRGKDLKELDEQNITNINSLLKACNSFLPTIGTKGALLPDVDEMARCLMYERVMLMNKRIDFTMFRQVVDRVKDDFNPVLDFYASSARKGKQPSIPKIPKLDYMDFRVGRCSLSVDDNKVMVNTGEHIFFFKSKQVGKFQPNWVEFQFDDDGVHITMDYDRCPTSSVRGNYVAEKGNGIYVSADVGLNSVLTMCNNVGIRPVTINGRLIKSTNRKYNIAIKSTSKKKLPEKELEEKIQAIDDVRVMEISRVFDGVCSKAVAYCMQCNAKEMILGYTDHLYATDDIEGFDDFRAIPFDILFDKLGAALGESGIRMTVIEDFYTSQTSFFDGEPAEAGYAKPERRVSCAQFVTEDNLTVHADVNAAYQILVKAKPDCIRHLIRVYPYPIKVNPIEIKIKRKPVKSKVRK